MSKHLPTDGISRMMIIRERDVGLFSMFWQVLNTLYQLHIHQIDRIPVVILGEGLIYYHPEGHNGSSLSTAAGITVPETIRVNRRYGLYFLHRLVSFCRRYCSRDGHWSRRRAGASRW